MSKMDYLDYDAAVQLQSEVERIIVEWTGMQAPLAGPLAKLVVEGLQQNFGGQRLYIPARRPKCETLAERAQRDLQIAAMFNGRNASDVMQAFGVSRRTIYNAVARAKKLCK